MGSGFGTQPGGKGSNAAVACAPQGARVALIWVYDDGDHSIAVIPGAGAGLGAGHAQAAAQRIRAAHRVMAPNESELAALAPTCGLGADAAPEAIAQALLQQGVGAVVLTQGAAGCTRYRRGSPPLTVPGHRMAIVADTIGAGDTFTGALAAALARGLALDAALPWANAAAALSVTGSGALSGMPDQAVVAALLGRA